MPDPITVTLSTGRPITLLEPRANDLRGVKLLDVLQLDVAACAPLMDRVSDLTAAEFMTLRAPDALALMTVLVGFFGPSATDDSPPVSTTASN